MSPETRQSEELMHHAKALRAMARALIGNRSEAEDLVQDTLVLALESPPTWGDGIGAWLRGVLRRKIRHRHRAEASRARRERSSAKREALPATVDLVARRAQLATLVDEVLSLKEPYQTVLYLRFFEEKGPGEIARELSLPEGTIASQVSRGLDLLRARLDARAGGNRDAWVGALLPWFASETASTGIALGGAGMVGSLKLVGSALVLGSLLMYVAGKEDRPREVAGLVPSRERVAIRAEVPLVAEPVALVQPNEELLGETSLKAAPDRTVETAPLLDASEQSVVAAPEIAPPSSVVPPVPLPSSPSAGSLTLTSTKVKRSFQLEMEGASDPTDGAPLVLLDGVATVNIPWVYEFEVDFVDQYATPVMEGLPEFQRTVTGEWALTFPKFQTNSTVPDMQTTEGRSPFLNRIQRFKRHQAEERYVASFVNPEATDDPEWLSQLVADLDMRAFQPPPDIMGGQVWSVPGIALAPLVLPGGNLRIQFDPEQGDLPNMLAAEADSPPGPDSRWDKMSCELTSFGIDPTSHRPSMQFSLTLSYEGPLLQQSMAGALQADSKLEPLSWNSNLQMSGTGRWDLRNRRLAELEVEGQLILTHTPQEGSVLFNAQITTLESHSSLKISMQTDDAPTSFNDRQDR